MMPGEPTYIKGVSYWEPNLDASKKYLHDFFLREKKPDEQLPQS